MAGVAGARLLWREHHAFFAVGDHAGGIGQRECLATIEVTGIVAREGHFVAIGTAQNHLHAGLTKAVVRLRQIAKNSASEHVVWTTVAGVTRNAVLSGIHVGRAMVAAIPLRARKTCCGRNISDVGIVAGGGEEARREQQGGGQNSHGRQYSGVRLPANNDLRGCGKVPRTPRADRAALLQSLG